MPTYEFRLPRLHVDDALAAGQAVATTPAQANYLANVMRLEDGAEVLVFNGRDGEWHATLARPSRKRLDLVPSERVREQTPAADLHCLFAPLKTGRLDYMIQKATEMGAGHLRPVMTQHGQMPRFNVERARANAVEAAEQCGILSVPRVRGMERLDDILSGWDGSRTLLFCDERVEATSPIETLRPLAGRPLALLIGPEGGFSEKEGETLRALPFVVPMSLGPRILRADTAAVAALALVQAAAGDWPR